ncbi:MAG: PorP/SprF family type IX secretion system membrane protein [Saprospiraceae bacterium]|nr:PorP/SprF family type IX secretion system membrane protein [Saprospiraceae bacterium]
MKRVVFSVMILMGVLSTKAQDIHFSQFYLSPLNLNPAMTGVMNCNTRLVANYRNQWASVLKSNAFNTYSVSYDQRIAVGRYDYIGVGGVFWGDQAGESRFSTTTGKLSFSYSKRMGGNKQRNDYLVVGAQGGVAQRSIDFLNLRWPNQHDGEGGFDPSLSSGESTLNDNFLFADAEAGLLWFSVNEKKGSSFYAGAAFHHLNRANQSFFDGGESLLYTRFTGHMGGDLPVSSKFGLVPGVIVMKQGPSFQVNGGTSLKFLLGDSREYQAFQVGAWMRLANRYEDEENSGILADAAILSTRFDYNSFSIGFSYDVNISPLATASNGNGGFEFALVYKICGAERRGVYCPRF